jgi:hypothetical protein
MQAKCYCYLVLKKIGMYLQIGICIYKLACIYKFNKTLRYRISRKSTWWESSCFIRTDGQAGLRDG